MVGIVIKTAGGAAAVEEVRRKNGWEDGRAGKEWLSGGCGN